MSRTADQERADRMTALQSELAVLDRHEHLTRTQARRYHEAAAELEDLERSEGYARILSAAYAARSGAPTGELRLEGGAPSEGDPITPREPEPTRPQSPMARHLTGLRGEALRMIDRAEHAPDHARHRVASLLDVAEGVELDLAAQWTRATLSEHYESACRRLFRDPTNGHREFSGEELAAWQQAKTVQRAMSLSDASGGFLLPFVLDPNIIISSAGSVNPMRELARIETTVTDQWAGVTSAGITANWRAEAAETTDASPTLTQPNIAVHKADAFVIASIEVAADARIGEQLAPLFTDAKDQLEATAQTTGSGTGQPKGIITALVAAGGSVVIATATNVLAQADLYNNQASLPARWRPRARWMMNLSILNGYRQLPQATGLNYSIINDDGELPRALGWTIHENSIMDGTLGAGADYTVLSGDFRQFCIVDRIGATVEFIPHLFGPTNRYPTGQRGWYMYWRTGSDVLVADAFRLTNHST